MAGTSGPADGKTGTAWMTKFFPLQGLSGLKEGTPPFATTWMARQYAQGALTSLNMLESWVSNYRTVTDAWRASLRQQQDAFLDSTKAQLKLMSPTMPAEPEDAGKAAAPPTAGTEKATASKTRETA